MLELRRILLKEGVLQEGESRDTGLVPVAVFRDGKYTSLTSGYVNILLEKIIFSIYLRKSRVKSAPSS